MADDDETDRELHEIPAAQPEDAGDAGVVFMTADDEAEPGPLDPWATIRRWAAAMAMAPPDGIVPMRKAFDQVLELTDGDVALRGPWLDRIAIWGFHMHIRPQRMAPEVLRTGNLDEEAESVWYRAPRFSVGAPQNRLWLGVAAESLDELLEEIRASAAGPSSASVPVDHPAHPDFRVSVPQPGPGPAAAAAVEPEGELRCRLCGLSSHGHWLLLSCGGRLVQVCIDCAREVATAVRRK